MSSTEINAGFIGLGFMGRPMSLNLLRAGHQLHVWARNPDQLTEPVAQGAVAGQSAKAVVEAADICFLCLSDTAAVEAVVFGPGGVAAGGSAGKILVDHSSIEPDATLDFSQRLARETGMHWIDAPVSGGPPGARDGSLAIMAGAAEQIHFDRVRPCFDAMGRATLMGPVGSGQSTKLINQLIVGCTMAMVAESTALAKKAGLSPQLITQALSGGRADSLILQHYMVKMASEDETIDSYIHTIVKDLDTVTRMARTTSSHTPMLAMAREIYKVVADRGRADADVSRVIEYYR